MDSSVEDFRQFSIFVQSRIEQKMDRETYDNQKLKAYLLGEPSGADADAFDEASFTDENFGAALSAAENDLIDAYLQNELRGAELKKFESVYLSTKHRREKIEFARALQTFAGKEILNSKTETEKTGFFAWRNIFGNRNRALQFGFAAAALLVLFFGIFWFTILRRENAGGEIVLKKTPTPENSAAVNQNSAPENKNSNESVPSAIQNPANENSQNSNEKMPETNKRSANVNKNSNEKNQTPDKKIPVSIPQEPLIATFFLAPPLRGANKIPLFDVPKNASQINVELQIEADDYKTYHVTLTNETGDINLWRRSSLKAKSKGANKFLNVNFPAKLLGNGFYSLTVSGVNENGEAEIVANYPFRIGEK